MDINRSDYSRKAPLALEPSIKPIAGSPSVKYNGSVKYKPTSSYGHIPVVPNQNYDLQSRNNNYYKSVAYEKYD